MQVKDEAKISSSMATTVFGEMLSEGLEVLRSSEVGRHVIHRVEAKVQAGV